MSDHDTRGLRGIHRAPLPMLRYLAAMMATASMLAGPVLGVAPGPARAGPNSAAMQERDSGPCCRHLLQQMGDEAGPEPTGYPAQGQTYRKDRRR